MVDMEEAAMRKVKDTDANSTASACSGRAGSFGEAIAKGEK